MFRGPDNPLVLSVMVGNGSQLCAMVGVTLGMKSALVFSAHLSHLTYSFCFARFPLAFQPWIACYGHDDMLDVLRKVSSIMYSKLVLILRQHWRLHFKSIVCYPGRDRPSEECFLDCNYFTNVGSQLFRQIHYRGTWNRFIFVIVFFLNFFLLMAGSSGAVPFGEA